MLDIVGVGGDDVTGVLCCAALVDRSNRNGDG